MGWSSQSVYKQGLIGEAALYRLAKRKVEVRPVTAATRTFMRRRQILAGLGALAWAAPKRAHARPDHVIVVGGGLAGLAAAHRLRGLGAKVTVLEARMRPGGRVHTVRAPFAGGLHGEAGAARIADTHGFVLNWVNEFGLRLSPFLEGDLAPVFAFDAKRYRMNALAMDEAIAKGLSKAERGLTPPQLLTRYTESLPGALKNSAPEEGQWREWQSFDRVTWTDFLRARGASPEAVALMTLGNDAQGISALYVLRQIMLHRDVRRYHKIEGGNDLLPRAFAKALGGDLRYGAKVVSIADGSPMRVTYESKGRRTTLEGERVLVAVPYSVLKTIAVDAKLSPLKRKIIAELPYRSATRVLLQTSRAFWRTDGESGWARTDAPAEIWDDSAGQRGGGLLSLTLSGASDKEFQTRNTDARLARAVEIASAAFPETRLQFQNGTVHRWAEEPFSRGAFAEFHPGQMTALFPRIAEREERMHFAGEHTSAWTGWMEGALESAERAAREIAEI